MSKRIFSTRHLTHGAVLGVLDQLVPRPLAWVATTSADDRPHLATQSLVSLVSADPPMVGLTLLGDGETLANIERSHEFVVSFATADSIRRVEAVSGTLRPDADTLDLDIPLEPADTVAVQRPTDAAMHVECTLHAVLNFGNGHLVIGRVKTVAVDEPALGRTRRPLAVVGS